MRSPCQNLPNSNKRKQKTLNREHDLERPQLTSNDLKGPQLTSKESRNENVIFLKSKNKNSLKGGSVHNSIEINGDNLDESLQINNI